jgi:hypothetical protein
MSVLRGASPVAIVMFAGVAALATQSVDRSRPPTFFDGDGGFTVRRLADPISVDGRNWIEVRSIATGKGFRAPNGAFTLTFRELADSGELVRDRVFFAEGTRVPVEIERASTYTYVTPDSRWIVLEPIEVIDVTTWRRYSLSKVFKIEPFVVLRAISSDRRRLYLSRQPCPFDCQHLPHEYYEITFPLTQPSGGDHRD